MEGYEATRNRCQVHTYYEVGMLAEYGLTIASTFLWSLRSGYGLAMPILLRTKLP